MDRGVSRKVRALRVGPSRVPGWTHLTPDPLRTLPVGTGTSTCKPKVFVLNLQRQFT